MHPQINPSLQKKTAARMAAAQCLYEIELRHEAIMPEDRVAQVKARLHNNKQEQKLFVGVPLEPNYALLEALLAGVRQWETEIYKRLDGVLKHDWKRERMSPLILAILRLAVFELFFYKDTKPGILIDEYTRLSRHFFAEGEVNFVHGLLTNLTAAFSNHG